MLIEVIGVQVTDEQGLGPCYRIVQRSPQGIELYILPRSAVAADMEMYGVEDPLHVLDWRLHGYRGHLPPVEPSLRLAAAAQQAQTAAERGRARFATGREHALAEIDQANDDAERLKAEARAARDAEVAEIKAAVTVVDDAGLDAVRALVLGDLDAITADRERYREQLGNSEPA